MAIAPAIGHVLDVLPGPLNVADLGLGGAGGATHRLAFLGVVDQIVLYPTVAPIAASWLSPPTVSST